MSTRRPESGSARAEFARLLRAHMDAGTRPRGIAAVGAHNVQWFAAEIGVSKRQCEYYRDGSRLPRNLAPIVAVLFGEDEEFEAPKQELIEAFHRARGAQSTTPRWAISNVPVLVPRHFLGRNSAIAQLAKIRTAKANAVPAAVHGIAGVGKTSLAAAFAELHRRDYIATWWIRAQAGDMIESDLKSLAQALGWHDAASAFKHVLDRIRNEREPILLIYDNAIDARSLAPYLPRGGNAHVIITSNAPDWRGVAEPVELDCWDAEIGADYLIARTDRADERGDAIRLSQLLGGLPLAHEQAGGYCEHLGVGFRDYIGRLCNRPVAMLDDEDFAATEYHDGTPLAQMIGLAFSAAGEMHPGALDVFLLAAVLPCEPIPLYLFRDAPCVFDRAGENLAGDALDKAIAALQAYGLIYRETITRTSYGPDETVSVDVIRFHRLVWSLAASSVPIDVAERLMVCWFRAFVQVFRKDKDNPVPDDKLGLLQPFYMPLLASSAEFDLGKEGASLYIEFIHLYADYAADRVLGRNRVRAP